MSQQVYGVLAEVCSVDVLVETLLFDDEHLAAQAQYVVQFSGCELVSTHRAPAQRHRRLGR